MFAVNILRKSNVYKVCFSVALSIGTIQRASCQHLESSHISNAEAISKAIALKRDPYDVVDEDEELEWDIKRENCSFCRTFLDSPCRINFQRWSKCVDQAKKHGEDYIGLCKSYTEALVGCTQTHNEYFELLHRKQSEVSDSSDEPDNKDSE